MGRWEKQKSHRTSQNPFCRLKIHLQNNQKDFFIDRKAVREAVPLLLEFLSLSCEEIGIYFVTTRKISQLHEEFFSDPSATDCITFPIDKSYLGEIFICPKIALAYASEHQLCPKKELFLYLIHGILHLSGLDDQTEEERRVMRKKEKSCMDYLESKNIGIF